MRILKDYGGIKPFRSPKSCGRKTRTYRDGGQAALRGQDGGRLRRHRRAWAASRKSPTMPGPLPAHCRRLPASPGRQEERCWWSPRRTREAARHHARRSARSCATAGKLGDGGPRIHPAGARSMPARPNAARPATYRPGDVLQFHQNAKGGFTKGERLIVTDPAAVPLSSMRASSRSTGRKPSPWPRATSSGSPARSKRWTASTRSKTA